MGLIHKPTIILVLAVIGPFFLISVYNLYYIKVFFDEFHLPPGYLKIVQLLFLVWNAINDPIMGYMQDLGFAGMEWIMDRRKVILYAGPVFAASFLLFWFPWSTTVGWITALHLLVSLFVYDTLFTLVLSAYCGLCVENSTTHKGRVRVIVYSEMFSVLAGFLIFPMEIMPHSNENFWMFQLACVAIAIVAGALMIFSGLSWQIAREPRFICLVGAQFFRILRYTANENFLIVFTEALLVRGGFFEKGSKLLGGFYILARSLGSILFLSLWSPTNKYGSQAIVQSLCIVSVVNIAFLLFAGVENLWAIAIFIVVENALCRCGWQGFYMIVAGEVIDTDMKENNRKNPFSTIIFTLKALFNKPADQIAPVMVLAFFLERGGYPELTPTCSTINTIHRFNSTSTEFPDANFENCTNYTNWIFLALALFPAICTIGESLFVLFDQNWKRTHHSEKQ
ncbi:unnamed protein product [Caenorhabditis bovis]|uniref:Uncharacterized protein n=1 Tax=Caenorhabditis bovis TaxID=2654633 RepID=A0A8S1F014_9PELO|nr:unnamed protein product [Caenorhabditis bovis]